MKKEPIYLAHTTLKGDDGDYIRSLRYRVQCKRTGKRGRILSPPTAMVKVWHITELGRYLDDDIQTHGYPFCEDEMDSLLGQLI